MILFQLDFSMPSHRSSFFSSSRRPSTAPASQYSYRHHLDIASISSSGHSTPVSYGKSNRIISVVGFPAVELKERRGIQRVLGVEGGFHSLNPKSTNQDLQASKTPDSPRSVFGIEASSPLHTQEEWKLIHERQQDLLSSSQRWFDASTQLNSKRLKGKPVPMQPNTPPPPYSSTMSSGIPVEEELTEPLRQEGFPVTVYRGRRITEHIVPIQPHAHPAPPPPAQPQGMSSTSAPDVEAGGITPSSSGASEGRRGSLVERFTNTARSLLHLPGPAPPIPPRSPNRPRTANAALPSPSIPISYLPRPTTEGIVPSPIPEVSIENTPILGAPVESTPSPPPNPFLQPVHNQSSELSPISPIDSRQFQTGSPHVVSPLVENRLPTPLSARRNGAPSPRGNASDASDGSPDFAYTAETFPLERIVNSDPPRHSRGSQSMMLLQLASNLRVEAEEDPDITAANMRSPDLSMWHNGASSPSLSRTPLVVADDSSSFYNSPVDPVAPVPAVPMQRTSPFFGGGSLSRRRGSSATSAERATIHSEPDRAEQLADTAEERAARTRRAGSDPVLLRYASTRDEWPGTSPVAQRASEPNVLVPAGSVAPLASERYAEGPSYVPVTRASMGSATQHQQEHGTIGSFSSAAIGSPSTWSNPLRSTRSIMSTQRGSAEHEQIFTPESIYTPLVAEHGDDPTQAALHRPRSPEIAPRDLGSQDSGQGDRGQHNVCLEETPGAKEELVTSATMVATSTMSQHSSYKSFPSDAPLLSMIGSSSADSMRPEQAETEETPRLPQPSARQRVLLAAQRFHMGLPSDYENKKRMWVPMPKSYLNYNPEDEDPPSTYASSTPRFTDIPIASGSGTQSETPPGPRTIHQALEPEPVSTAVANVPEQPERPASVGLGIGLPPDPAADTAEAGPSSTSEQYDPVKTPMDRLLAGKVKEKKADAGDYLRKQGKAALDLKDQFVASVSRRRQSVQRGFNGKRRRSIVISPPTPILEAKSERDTPRVSQTEVSQLPASAQQRPQTAGSTSEYSHSCKSTLKCACLTAYTILI